MNIRKERERQLRRLLKDDGKAAKSHLTAGRPIFYCDDEVSSDYIIREWPNGQRELIDVNHYGSAIVIKKL